MMTTDGAPVTGADDALTAALRWRAQGRGVALATVIRT